jgi:multiple sugar transport system permease protein
MAILSTIGRRSFKVRFVIAVMYLTLAIGAISMLYPLLLMLSGSAKSDADFSSNTPLIEYLWNDDVLWSKYLESKYTRIDQLDSAHGTTYGSWNRIRPPIHLDASLAQSFRQFRHDVTWPRCWASLGHAQYLHLLAKNARKFRGLVQQKFDGDLTTYNRETDSLYASWLEVGPPRTEFVTRRFNFPKTRDYELWEELKLNSPKSDWIASDIDAAFVSTTLRPRWNSIEAYNAAHGTRFADYRQVLLPSHPPKENQQRIDWASFVRNDLGIAFIRVLPDAMPALRSFLRSRYDNRVALLNHAWNAEFAQFDEVQMPEAATATDRARADLIAFIKEGCPLESLEVSGIRQAFESLTDKPADTVRLPTETVDWLDFQEQKAALRWEFATRNYRTVLAYLWQHGKGIRNTAIFCGLMIAANLLVNPIAAYALSRYRPRFTYAILLFCMATMAFPAEVTMIPSFLLLKQFPLLPLLLSSVATLIALWGGRRAGLGRHSSLNLLIALAVGVSVGFWIGPFAAKHILAQPDMNISLLNSFWALVLPGVANGFSIFLLKGFFDSLPTELFEAADLDGATEWHKFWLITMSLSKPILAVIALGVFTAAYSEFLMALVIVPDSRMWTMMVWLFQLQISSHPSVVYASLVVAAVPTFAVFLFAQNLILRGIVVPTEK